MYKPSKRVLAACLTAGVVFSAFNTTLGVKAGQEYDSSNVGISGKVGEYIEKTESEDPVADLTNGIVTKADVESAFAEATTADSIEDASGTDASATDASATDASPTDAKLYKQFGGAEYLFMADVWKPKELGNSGHLWIPIRFEDGKPVLKR